MYYDSIILIYYIRNIIELIDIHNFATFYYLTYEKILGMCNCMMMIVTVVYSSSPFNLQYYDFKITYPVTFHLTLFHILQILCNQKRNSFQLCFFYRILILQIWKYALIACMVKFNFQLLLVSSCISKYILDRDAMH